MFSARCGVLCLILSLPLVAQSQANASSPDLSQEAFVLEHWNESVRFENEGSGVRETTAVIRIQSQAGVREFGQKKNCRMKKIVLALTLGTVLVPSLWAGPPAITVQDQQPTSSTATTSFFSYLLSLFS